ALAMFCYVLLRRLSVFFFFQAEDGIRDFHVTGVQTCALPILLEIIGQKHKDVKNVMMIGGDDLAYTTALNLEKDYPVTLIHRDRSEERRVGKECRSRWWGDE